MSLASAFPTLSATKYALNCGIKEVALINLSIPCTKSSFLSSRKDAIAETEETAGVLNVNSGTLYRYCLKNHVLPDTIQHLPHFVYSKLK